MMSNQVTVALPEHIFRRAQRFAELTGSTLETAISDMLILSLPPLTSEFDMTPIETLSDEDILALADSQMDVAYRNRMSSLQFKQQAGLITAEERAELHMLMEVYNAGQIRKTQALVEAVKRGLRASGAA